VRYRELHRRCEKHVRRVVADVGLPQPFVLREFLDRLAARRGRRIELFPHDHVPGAACGMWLRLAEVDVIVYARTAQLHEEHIILHEVGHMLCDHRGTARGGDDVLRLLMPDLDPMTVRAILGRTSYSDAEEQEAELIATLILERVADRRPEAGAPRAPGLAGELHRLHSAFEG
jgi:hypothetical protein